MREITYQVNNWKPSIFVATKGQSDLEVLRILQAKYRSVTIRLIAFRKGAVLHECDANGKELKA